MAGGSLDDMREGLEVGFREFVLFSARATAYLIGMRDEPSDAPVPREFHPSGSQAKQRDKARSDLADIKTWDDATAEREAQLSYEERLTEYTKYVESKKALRRRCQDLLEKVQAWQPPTADHEPLKAYMVQQLTAEIEFQTPLVDPPARLTGAEYKAKRIAEAQRDLEIYSRLYDESVVQAEKRTVWVQALLESLSE